MRFEWDEAKNKANIRKHGFDFADAWRIFEGPLIVNLDRSGDYNEDRWKGYGLLNRRVVAVVFTERKPDILRIISLRKATAYESKKYEGKIKNRLGTY